MPAARRRSAVALGAERSSSPAVVVVSEKEKEKTLPQQAAIDAAVSAPTRRRKQQQSNTNTTVSGNQPFLTTWDAAPNHVRDNRFIIRGYRAGAHTFKTSFMSLLSIHNETGNIWTHLIGFIIFILLTVATVQLRPAPFRLGAEAYTALEARLHSLGLGSAQHANIYDLIASAESWKRTARQYGADKLSVVEDKLRSITHANLGDLSTLLDSLGSSLRRYGASGMAELTHLEEKIVGFGSELKEMSAEAVRDIESALHRTLLASTLDSTKSMWPVSRWPIHVFTAGACLCLLISAVCHLFGCCSAHITSIMWRFDYAGIAVLIVASFFPPVYYGFLCQPNLRAAYLAVTTVLGVCTTSVTLLDRFQSPEWHSFRAALFCGLGLWGIVPMAHGLALNSGASEVLLAMQLDILMGAIYLLGAAIYVSRVPERWKPGAFDVAFHSHQLFHVAVVVAAVVHYKASHGLMQWRDATGGCMAM